MMRMKHGAGLMRRGTRTTMHGTGTGTDPVDATVQALGRHLRIDHFEERSAGADAPAWTVVEMACLDQPEAPGSGSAGTPTSPLPACRRC